MFAPGTPARLNSIFDWELATIGDPLADVGYLVATWGQAGDPETPFAALGGLTRGPGFPTRDELIARYEAGSGPLDVRRALVHDARAVEVRRSSSRAPTSGASRARPTTRGSTCSSRACRTSPSARGGSRRAAARDARRAAGRLRRRPDLERVRLLRGLLPRRGAAARHGARPLQAGPRRARGARRPRDGARERSGVRGALRPAARRRAGRGPDRPPVRAHGARRGDVRRRRGRAPRRDPHRARVELVGRGGLRPHPLRRAVRRAS